MPMVDVYAADGTFSDQHAVAAARRALAQK
jgi:hypothetical protein